MQKLDFFIGKTDVYIDVQQQMLSNALFQHHFDIIWFLILYKNVKYKLQEGQNKCIRLLDLHCYFHIGVIHLRKLNCSPFLKE